MAWRELVRECDGRTVLAETPFAVDPERRYELTLEMIGNRLRGLVDGGVVLTAEDTDRSLRGGGVGLVICEGTLSVGPVSVERLELFRAL